LRSNAFGGAASLQRARRCARRRTSGGWHRDRMIPADSWHPQATRARSAMTHCCRSLVSLRGPSTPRDFPHHAVLRAVDPRLFDGVVRHLRQRLYAGRVDARAGTAAEVRAACMRQGPPPWSAALLLAAGGIALAARAPLQSPVATWLWSLAMVGAAAITCTPRKHLWMVAHPGAAADTIDLWLAGTSAHGAAAFASEFARLVAEAARLQEALAAAPPNAAETAPANEDPERMQRA
jgi:hypothetical protein